MQDHLTSGQFTQRRWPICTMYFHLRNFPKVSSSGITQTIGLKCSPTQCRNLDFKLQGGQLILPYISEFSLQQNWLHTLFLSFFFSNWFQMASVITNLFQAVQNAKQKDNKPSSHSLNTAMGWMVPYQYILWKALWLVWCRPRPVPTLPRPSPSWM